MRYVKDWVDAKTGGVQVRCSRKESALAFGLAKTKLSLLDRVAKNRCVELIVLRNTTDLIAIPGFLAFVGPHALSRGSWEKHFSLVYECLGPSDCHYCFFGKRPDIRIPEPMMDSVYSVAYDAGQEEVEAVVRFVQDRLERDCDGGIL